MEPPLTQSNAKLLVVSVLSVMGLLKVADTTELMAMLLAMGEVLAGDVHVTVGKLPRLAEPKMGDWLPPPQPTK
jgi:hypothetical protein